MLEMWCTCDLHIFREREYSFILQDYAELQKLLEKAHIELRDNSSGNSKRPHSELAFFSNSKPSSTTGLATKNLREELKITQDQLETLGKQREEDLDMYLKLAADSRRMFTQGLKETLEK